MLFYIMKRAVTSTPKDSEQAYEELKIIQQMRDDKKLDLAEMRADFANLSPSQLEDLVKDFDIPMILTNRHPEEGGKYEGSEEDRINLLRKGIELGVSYVDIESQYFDGFSRLGIDANNSGKTKIISSAHFFNGMPDLDEQYDKMTRNNAHHFKIAARIDNVEQLIHMLRFSESHKDNIFVGMGDSIMEDRDHDLVASFMKSKGYSGVASNVPKLREYNCTFSLMSRLLMGYFGGHLTYASLGKGGEAAPGIPDVENSNRDREILGYSYS